MRLENVDDVYPLTPTQEGMLFHSLASPNSGVYVQQLVIAFDGAVDVERLRSSWETVVRRHAVLRTAVLWDGLEQPLQVVRSAVSLSWQVADWRRHDDERRGGLLREYLQADRTKGFDLAAAPLMRFAFMRYSDTQSRLVWTFHHMLLDGWSKQLILRELMRVYSVAQEASELQSVASFRDYVEWRIKQPQDEGVRFWQEQLRDFTAPTRLPSELASSHGGTRRVSQREFRFGKDLSSRLRSLAAESRVTLNTVINAAWAVLLSRYADSEDVVFGVTTSGRKADLDAADSIVGLLIQSVPVRAVLSDDLSVREFIQRVQQSLVEVRRFDYVPLPDIKKCTEVPPGAPLFETLVVFENYPGVDEDLAAEGSLRITNTDYYEQSNYPLALLFVPEQELRLIVVYSEDLFREDELVRLAERLEVILQSFTQHPDGGLNAVPISTQADREILDQVNASCEVVSDVEGVLKRIADNARTHRDEIAIVCGSSRITYGELIDWAGRLADGLRKNGAVRGDVVCLRMRRSIDMVVGMLASLSIGAPYVPVDADYPVERLRYIVNDSDASFLVTQKDLVDRHVRQLQTLLVENYRCGDRPKRYMEDDLSPVPADLAYVMYTSGSTGEPKGVMVSQHNLSSSTDARTKYYGVKDFRSFLLVPSFMFDSSVAGLYGTLCAGGKLVIIESGEEQDLRRLTELIRDEAVSQVLLLPSLYGILTDEPGLENAASLSTVIVAGEDCSPDVVRRHLDRFPDVRLVNEYGPTEGTVWTTAWCAGAGWSGRAVPIGKPVGNTRIHVLDRRRRVQPPGLNGEIYIEGDHVAVGYLNKRALTENRFVEVTLEGREPRRMFRTGDRGRVKSDGHVEFLGRIDNQVKLRGYRVEPGEIEAAISSHPFVKRAAVVPMASSWRSEPNQGSDEAARRRLLAQLSLLDPREADVLISSVKREGGVDKSAGDQDRSTPLNSRASLEARIIELTADEVDDLSRLAGVESGRRFGYTQKLVAFVTQRTSNDGRVIDRELRQYLQPQLPAYMLPTDILVVDELPLTRTGKVDRRALATMYSPRRDLQPAPVGVELRPSERVLSKIWEEVLGVVGVGVDDDFFELGGDSILSIRITSLARQAGIELAPADIFEASNIRDLVELAAARTPLHRRDLEEAGVAALTPIQRWFMDLAEGKLQKWNQAVAVRLPCDLEMTALETVLRKLVGHHQALRFRFEQTDGQWSQRVVEVPDELPLRLVDLRISEAPDEAVALAVAEEYRLVEPENGVSVRFVVFDTGETECLHLVIVAHHLVVDLVSWGYLLQDLDTLVDQTLVGSTLMLPRGSSSFVDWSRMLVKYSESSELLKQSDYWRDRSPAVGIIPLDYVGPRLFLESDVDSVEVHVSPDVTESLFDRLPRAFSARPNEVLLAAFLQSLRAWSHSDELVVGMEGHGRHAPDKSVDVSRTVGWFTTYYPMKFDLDGLEDDLAVVAAVKEEVRAVPDGGIGYGVLRYLVDGRHKFVSDHPEPEVVFNYHGGRPIGEWIYRRLAPSSIPVGAWRSSVFKRSGLLEVNCRRVGDNLQVEFQYSTKLHSRQTVQALAERTVSTLARMIDQALNATERRYSPADFPAAGLDQSQLDALLRRIDESNRES